MPLEIEIARDAYRAGDLVRGSVRGLSEFPEARGVTVALVHEGDHLPDAEPVEAYLEVPAGADVFPFDLPLPLDALPSFRGERFGSAWSIRATVDLRRRIDPKAERDVRVLPTSERVGDPGDPVRGDTTGTRRFVRGLAIFAVLDLLALVLLFALVADPPVSIVTWFVVPLFVSLAIVALLRGGGPVDRLEIEVPRARWRFGETVPVTVRIEGDPGGVGALEVGVTGAEEWTTSSGSSTRHHREVFHEETRRFEHRDLVGHRTAARAWNLELAFTLPDEGLPSVEDRIVWDARATIDVRRRLDPMVRAALEVSGARPDPES